MATRKTSSRRTSGGAGSNAGAHHDTASQAEQLTRSLSESAQQIWLAGMGAFNRAQAEGTRLFEGLVREGMGLEQNARRFADQQARTARRTVESTVETARDRALDGWDKLEKGLEDRVHRTLLRMGVPDRNDLAELSRRVDALTAELRSARGASAPRPAAAAPRKRAPGKAAAQATRAAPAARAGTAQKTARAAKPKAARKATRPAPAKGARRTP